MKPEFTNLRPADHTTHTTIPRVETPWPERKEIVERTQPGRRAPNSTSKLYQYRWLIPKSHVCRPTPNNPAKVKQPEQRFQLLPTSETEFIACLKQNKTKQKNPAEKHSRIQSLQCISFTISKVNPKLLNTWRDGTMWPIQKRKDNWCSWTPKTKLLEIAQVLKQLL